jgi:hypothetical protein
MTTAKQSATHKIARPVVCMKRLLGSSNQLMSNQTSRRTVPVGGSISRRFVAVKHISRARRTAARRGEDIEVIGFDQVTPDAIVSA